MEPWNFDVNTLLVLNFDGGNFLDQLMFTLSGTKIWIPLYIVVVYCIYNIHGWKYALTFLVMAGLLITCVDQTANLFKDSIPKLRPSHNSELEGLLHIVNGYKGGWYGTVSSHAANAIAFALFSSFAINKKWYFYAIVSWAMVISYTRIYLGVHYPMDIIFGLINGTIWTIIWWIIFVKIMNKIKRKKYKKDGDF